MQQRHRKPNLMVHPAVASRVRFSVALTCLLMEILLSCKLGHGHSAPGGGYTNPSMYGTYQNSNQQQWPPQTQQQQQQQQPLNQYFDNDQYQQQRQFEQPTSTVEPVLLPPLPPGWSEHIDPSSGQPYYYNSNDGSTTWDRPPPVPNMNATSATNDDMPPPQFDVPQSFSPSMQGHSNSTDSNESQLNDDARSSETQERSNQENLAVASEPAPSVEGDALTSISRDDNKVIEEDQWREAQGWNTPSDKSDGGDQNSNIGVGNDASVPPGWNLPPPQNPSNPWGMVEAPQPGRSEQSPPNMNEAMPQSRQPDQHRTVDPVMPPPNQDHSQKQQLYEEPKFTQDSGASNMLPNVGVGPNNNIAPPNVHRVSEPNPPIERASPPLNIHGKNQNQIPQYQTTSQHDSQRYGQQPPPTELSRPPPTQAYPYQYSQQRPGVSGQQQNTQYQGGNAYGQPPQQHQDMSQYRQTPQYAGRPMYNQYPPPNQANPQQSYGSPAVGQRGQLIPQEPQNLVKESLGRTWQSILGLKDKTKEVVETATNTVAQSARDATQTIAEKGTGWWGQAKTVIGSVFESEPNQDYSLSGIYGNAPAAPAKQDTPRNYPMNQNYPPQSRYPPQQQYPPQGPGQQQLPPQGRYPPGYGPPQPRVDAPYPYQQQDPRQAMPPIQRQVNGNSPEQLYPPQNRPHDPTRNEYNQHMRPGQQAPSSQQQPPMNPDESSPAWAHPGLTSDY